MCDRKIVQVWDPWWYLCWTTGWSPRECIFHTSWMFPLLCSQAQNTFAGHAGILQSFLFLCTAGILLPQGKTLWSHFTDPVKNYWGGITHSIRKAVACLVFYPTFPYLDISLKRCLRNWSLCLGLSVMQFPWCWGKSGSPTRLSWHFHTASKPTEPIKSMLT